MRLLGIQLSTGVASLRPRYVMTDASFNGRVRGVALEFQMPPSHMLRLTSSSLRNSRLCVLPPGPRLFNMADKMSTYSPLSAKVTSVEPMVSLSWMTTREHPADC